jgi:hypothetical protein
LSTFLFFITNPNSFGEDSFLFAKPNNRLMNFKAGGGGGENRTPVRKPSAGGTTCLVLSLNLIQLASIDRREPDELPKV